MDLHRGARFITAIVLLLGGSVTAAAGTADGNLIEYGRGGFADGGWGLMLYPAEVKIYADGRIVFGDIVGIWEWKLDPDRLNRHPRRGPYIRLLGRIRAEIPGEYASFRPKSLSFTVYEGATWREPVSWPFAATIPIVKGAPITISDPAAAAFVIDHSFGGFSWLQANVTENGKDYSLMLKSVPGWYEPEELELKLQALRDENR